MHTLELTNTIQSKNKQFLIQRLIAIWALSEAALGGILHAFRIPLTGIFINGAAVIIIALIAYFTERKGTILKATLIVLLVKGAVSPHTPLNAYLAVSLQGLIGELIYTSKKFFKFKTVFFSVFTMFLSGSQKIVVLTILFGKNLWESIDLFGNYLLQLFPFAANISTNYNVSYWIIGVYVGVHIIVGFFVGLFAAKSPRQINNPEKAGLLNLQDIEILNNLNHSKKRKKNFWLKKPSAIGILILASAIIVLTYIYPQFSESAAMKAITMVIRSVFIMLVWYLIAGPFFLKLYKNYIKKRGSKYTEDVDFTIRILPFAKLIVNQCWKQSKKYKNIKRIKHFILSTILNMLVVEIPHNEENLFFNRSQK